jgi:ribulose-5-phosphate 4-epimerase/fuculose-1-phosphate aldolase
VLQADERQVTWEEGCELAKRHGCLFVETSAKANVAVALAFEELALQIVLAPSLAAVENSLHLTEGIKQQLGGSCGSCW